MRLSLSNKKIGAGFAVFLLGGCLRAEPPYRVYISEQPKSNAKCVPPEVDTSQLPADWVKRNTDVEAGDTVTEVTVYGGAVRVLLIPTTKPSTNP